MKKNTINLINLGLSILMIAMAFINNIASLIIIGVLAILIFGLRQKAVGGSIIAYAITLTTVLFKLSDKYNFNNAISVSNSYVFMTQGICALIAVIVFGYNYLVIRKN